MNSIGYNVTKKINKSTHNHPKNLIRIKLKYKMQIAIFILGRNQEIGKKHSAPSPLTTKADINK